MNGRIRGYRLFSLLLVLILIASQTQMVWALTDNRFSVDESGTLIWCERGMTDVVIPSTWNGIQVKAIGGWLLQNDTTVRSVQIPEGILSIGDYAFDGCTNLAQVQIPKTVESVGENAFNQTAWLLSQDDCVVVGDGILLMYMGSSPDIVIPSTVRTIGISACTGARSASIPDSVTAIGDYAFAGFGGTQIELPKHLKSIGVAAFSDSNLSSIHIPASVETIGVGAFSSSWHLMSDLTVDPSNPFFASKDGMLFSKDYARLLFCPPLHSGRLDVPDGVREIGYRALYDCEFSEIHLPESLTAIEGDAFCYCVNLKSLEIPAKVTLIRDSSAFSYCPALTVTVAPGNTRYSTGNGLLYEDGVNLLYCSPTVTGAVSLPSGTQQIDDRAFQNCWQVTSIALPVGLGSIGVQSFQNCTRLTTMNLPWTLKDLGILAFDGCSSLKSLYFNGDCPRSNGDMDFFGGGGAWIPDGFALYHAEGTVGFDGDWNNYRTETFVSDAPAPAKLIHTQTSQPTKTIAFAAAPQIVNGRTLVPLRGIAEALGFTVDWRDKESPRRLLLTKGDTTVVMTKQVGQSVFQSDALVNGETVTMDVPAQIIGGSTFVPVRFLSEATGCVVDFDGVHQEVVVIEPKASGKTVVMKLGSTQARILQGSYEAGLRRMAVHMDTDARMELLKTISPDMPAPVMPRFFIDEGSGAQISILAVDAGLTIPQIQADFSRDYREMTLTEESWGYLTASFFGCFDGTKDNEVRYMQGGLPQSMNVFYSDKPVQLGCDMNNDTMHTLFFYENP